MKKNEKKSPVRCTQKVMETFCAQIASGCGTRGAAQAVGVPQSTIRGWIEKSAEFSAAYAAACAARIATIEDRIYELLEEADGLHEADMPAPVAKLRLDAIKLEIDSHKWLLAKLLPRKYGDKSQMEITGRDGRDLLPQHTPEQDAAFAALIASAQAKTPPPVKP